MTVRISALLTALLLFLSSTACNRAEGTETSNVRESLQTVWTIGDGAGEQAFGRATWVDFDSRGNVYVLDSTAQKIFKLAADGHRIAELGGPGMQSGQLSNSYRFALVNDRLYVANHGNGRIEVLSDSGEALPPVELAEVRRPNEISFANGRFYIARPFVPDGAFVYAYDRNWKFERDLRKGDPVAGQADVLRSHNTVCAGPDGLWIIYMLQDRIEKIGFDGKLLVETSRRLDWKFPKDETGRVRPEVLVHRACAVDPAGNLYVIYSNPADWKRGNDVYKFGADGQLKQKAFTLPIHNASMMRFDRDGNLFFSDGKTLTKAKVERATAR